VLTHNPYFHKSVSYNRIGNDHATYCKVSFFEVKKSESNVSTIRLCEQPSSNRQDDEDDMENYSPVQNSYTALWNEYKDARLSTTLLSIARRIVEYHFIELCSYEIENLRDEVIRQFGSDKKMQKLVMEIFKPLYDPLDEIHDIGDGLYFTATADADTSDIKRVFRQVFVATGQESHYEKMSGDVA
jgi:wobble nucleotide-excising tRNase